MLLALLRPPRTRPKPKLQAPSTIEYCQIVPTPLSLPTYIVSAKSAAPTVSLPMCITVGRSTARISASVRAVSGPPSAAESRSEEHTSELQSQFHLVCRLL